MSRSEVLSVCRDIPKMSLLLRPGITVHELAVKTGMFPNEGM